MKVKLKIQEIFCIGLFLCLGLPVFLVAQGNWELLIPSPTSNQMVSLYFVDDQTGWSVGEYGTILKTTDGGENWHVCEIDCMTDLLDVYFPTAQIGYIVGEDGLILKSMDAGESWAVQESSYSNNLQRIRFSDSETGWAIGEKGLILHTADGGETWQQQVSGSGEDLYGIVLIGQDKIIAVGNNHTILISENEGADWQSTDNSSFKRNHQDVYFANDSTGWVCGETEEFSKKTGYLLKTKNGGKSWSQLSPTSINIDNSYSTNVFEPFQQIYFKADLESGLGLYREPSSLYSSVSSYPVCTRDGGASWESYIGGYLEGFKAKGRFQFLSDSVVICTGFGGDFRFSDDGGRTWHFKNVDKRFWDNFLIAPDGSLHGLYSKQNADQNNYSIKHFESPNGGISWSEYTPVISFLDGHEKEVDQTINLGQFVGPVNNRLYTFYWNRDDSKRYLLFSDDFGKTYDEVRSGFTESMDFLTVDTLITASIIPDDSEPNNYKSCLKYSYSFDGGVTIENKEFRGIWNDLTALDFFNQKWVNDKYFLNSRVGFLVGSDGNILRTEDTGQSWENIYSGVVENLWDIEFVNATTGFIAGEFGRILKTDDRGETWRKTNSGTQEDVYSIGFLNANQGWAGTENGLRYTNDGGETWHGVPLRYEHGVIRHISFDKEGNGYAYTLSTYDSYLSQHMFERSGSYVYLLRMDHQSVNDVDDYGLTFLPQDLQLYANYPNPFNSSTHIQYDLPKSGEVSLRIFNIQGQLVRTLVNRTQEPGSHSAIWNGHSDAGFLVGSGVYIYQLECGDQIKQQKLLLLK